MATARYLGVDLARLKANLQEPDRRRVIRAHMFEQSHREAPGTRRGWHRAARCQPRWHSLRAAAPGCATGGSG